MKIQAEIKEDKILIQKQKDVGRLSSRSHFGKNLANDKLELDYIEATYLLDEQKIKIKKEKSNVSFKEIIKLAAKKILGFEIKYQVYKDLRKRGHIISVEKNKYFDFKKYQSKKDQDNENNFFVKTFSERDFLDILQTIAFLKKHIKNQELWYAIVDEEGDITYYNIIHTIPTGTNKEDTYKKIKATLMENRVIIFDKELSKELFEKEFYGKPFGEALQLSFVEALYLMQKQKLEIKDINDKKISKTDFLRIAEKIQSDIKQRLSVYSLLKKNGMIVKTGFKFGTHFRAYSKNPDETHAEHLVQVVPADYKGLWSDISRGVRLGHSVNKNFIFACFSKKDIDFINLGRLRP